MSRYAITVYRTYSETDNSKWRFDPATRPEFQLKPPIWDRREHSQTAFSIRISVDSQFTNITYSYIHVKKTLFTR